MSGDFGVSGNTGAVKFNISWIVGLVAAPMLYFGPTGPFCVLGAADTATPVCVSVIAGEVA